MSEQSRKFSLDDNSFDEYFENKYILHPLSRNSNIYSNNQQCLYNIPQFENVPKNIINPYENINNTPTKNINVNIYIINNNKNSKISI